MALNSARADHLAGLVARTAASSRTSRSRARRRWCGCRTCRPASAAPVANFRGSQQRAGVVARRPAAGRDAVARRRLAALPDGPRRRATCAGSPPARRSTPSRCSRPTAAASTSSATAAAPADLSHARRRRQRRARDLRRQLQHQPGDQPRRAHTRVHHARQQRAFASPRMDLAAAGGAAQALSATPATTRARASRRTGV